METPPFLEEDQRIPAVLLGSPRTETHNRAAACAHTHTHTQVALTGSLSFRPNLP